MREAAGTGVVEVYWVHASDWASEIGPLLSDAEQARAARLESPQAAQLSTVGAALLRAAAAERLGCQPLEVPVRRCCPLCGGAHGRPVLAGTGLEVSVSHSADVVGVALRAHLPLGLDVESTASSDVQHLGRSRGLFLHPLELEELGHDDPLWLLRYWVRKEAVLKASGDGLLSAMAALRVTRPDEAPRLLANGAATACQRDVRLHDLLPPRGHIASLALSGSQHATIVEASGDVLLSAALRSAPG